MKKIIVYLLFIALIPFIVSAANYQIQPTSCPVEYNSVSCTGGELQCGIDPGDNPYCYNMSLLSPSSNSTTYSTNNMAGYDGGGHIIDCEGTDAGEPYCDNSGAFLCERNESCHGSPTNRNTVCLTGSFGASVCGTCKTEGTDYFNCYGDSNCESTSTSACDGSQNNHYITATCDDETGGGTCECDTNYFACDGSIIDADGCEHLSGASCGGSTGTKVLDQCVDASNANCTSSTNSDCNDDDGDGNERTCNGGGGSPDYCEITSGGSCGNSTGTYAAAQCQAGTGNCTSAGTNLDCDDDDGDGNLLTCNGATGCEVVDGGACTVGAVPGTYNQCTCVVSRVVYWTGNETSYSTNASEIMLWAHDYGSGYLLNLTNDNHGSFLMNASGCMTFMDGTIQCTAFNGTVASGTADGLGNHTASINLNMSGNNITGINELSATDGSRIGFGGYNSTFVGMDSAINIHSNQNLGPGLITHALTGIGKVFSAWQSGKNNSWHFSRNSMGIFTDWGSTNVSFLSNALLMWANTSVTPRFDYDTGEYGASLGVEGAVEIGRSLYVHGSTSKGVGGSVFNGFFTRFGTGITDHMNLIESGIHVFHTRFENVTTPAGSVTILDDGFTDGTLSPFVQVPPLDEADREWIVDPDTRCVDNDQCARARGGNGESEKIMDYNFSSVNVTSMNLSFFFGKTGWLASRSPNITLYVGNNTGAGFVQLWQNTSTTDTSTDPPLQFTVLLPETMNNDSVVTIRAVFRATNQNAFAYLDSFVLQGSAGSDITVLTEFFDSEFCLGEGIDRGDGRCEYDIFWNDTTKVLEIPGNTTFGGVTQQDLNVTDSITLAGISIDDWADIGETNITLTTSQISDYNDTNAANICSNGEVLFGNGSCSVPGGGAGGNSSWNESYARTEFDTRYSYQNLTTNITTEWDRLINNTYNSTVQSDLTALQANYTTHYSNYTEEFDNLKNQSSVFVGASIICWSGNDISITDSTDGCDSYLGVNASKRFWK